MKSFKPNENFKHFLNFVSERQNIFWSRYFDLPKPHTEDEIFKKYKFTNVYRSLDRVSQFLIGNVLYNEKGLENDYSTEDIVYRIMIFKHFNKIETWQELENEFGDITTDVKIKEIISFLDHLQNTNILYNNAFMLTASFMRKASTMSFYGLKEGESKHSSYLKIFAKDLMNNDKNLYGLLRSKNMNELYSKLRNICGLGDFLSMQYSIDMNYSILFNFSEDEHIIAGPGSKRGIEGTFDIVGTPDYVKILFWVKSEFNNLLNDYNIDFNALPNREPSLMDIQNCFCETSKYLKALNPGTEPGNKRVKNFFKPSNEKIIYNFPPKWNVVL